MASVNPPSALRTPPKLKGDPLLRSYFEQIEFILYQLANRTGGQNDLIYEGGQAIDAILLRLDLIEDRLEIIEAAIADLYALIAALDVRVTDLEARVTYLEGSTVTTAVDFTTTGETAELTVICTNTVPITITMNLTPADKEKVNVVTQGTGTVTISGPVNGKTTTSIIGSYSSPHLIYTDAAGEWNFT